MKHLSIRLLSSAVVLAASCELYDGPAEPSLAQASSGLLGDPAAPVLVAFSKPIDPATLRLEIARYQTDDHGRLADESGDPDGKLSTLFSHADGEPDVGGALSIAADRLSATVTPKTPLPITPRLVLLVEPGLRSDTGVVTVARRKLIFGYQFDLTCNKPSSVLPASGRYFFVIDVKQPVGTQVRLFSTIIVDPATGKFRAQFVRASRNTDASRCAALGCKSTEACRTLPSPACVVPSERANSTDEFVDFLPDTTSPASYQFTTTGCVVDQPDGTAQFVNAPVDVFTQLPTVTLRNTRLTSQFQKDASGVLRVAGALSADEVLLGAISSGQGVGGLAGRVMTDAQAPAGIPDPPP